MFKPFKPKPISLTPEQIKQLAEEGVRFRNEITQKMRQMSIPTDYKRLYEQEKKKNEELMELIKDIKRFLDRI